MKNKILNLEKREKIKKLKKDRVNRARAKYKAALDEAKKSFRGKSPAQLDEIRKKLAKAKNDLDEELKLNK